MISGTFILFLSGVWPHMTSFLFDNCRLMHLRFYSSGGTKKFFHLNLNLNLNFRTNEKCYVSYFCSISPHTVRTCGPFLQILHVVWTVCLCVGHTSILCKNAGTDRDDIWWRTRPVNLYWMGSGSPPQKGALLRGGHVPARCNVSVIIEFLHSPARALRIVCVSLRVPKCFRFGLWLTLCTLNIHLLT